MDINLIIILLLLNLLHFIIITKNKHTNTHVFIIKFK